MTPYVIQLSHIRAAARRFAAAQRNPLASDYERRISLRLLIGELDFCDKTFGLLDELRASVVASDMPEVP